MKTTSSLTILALVLLIEGTGWAGSYTWNTTATGYWTNAANWLPVGVPAETDTVTIGQGGVMLPPDSMLALDDFHLYGGEIRGTFGVRGVCEWTNGVISSGTTTVRSNAVLRLVGDATKTLASVILNNEGWVAWTNASRITPAGDCLISNLPSGTFEAQGDGSIDRSGYAGSCTFYNLGTFRKTGGTGQTRVTALPFSNQGLVEARVGTLRFDTGYTQTSGTTWLAGGGVSAATPLDIQGGSVTGSGDLAASLKNGGLFSPGQSIGQVNILGDYTQTATGTLRIELAGRDPGQYDQVAVSGVASLAGMIEVALTNGFKPVAGDTFPVLTCASRSGTFASTNGCNLGNGVVLVPEYRTNGVLLVATDQTATVTLTAPVLAGTNLTFSLSTTTGTAYTLQATGALGDEPWQNILSFTGDGLAREIAIAIQTDTNRYFRVKVGD